LNDLPVMTTDTNDTINRRYSLKRIAATGAVRLGGLAVFPGTATAFSDGNTVKSTTYLNTRYRPGTESRVLATIAPGTEGKIMTAQSMKTAIHGGASTGSTRISGAGRLANISNPVVTRAVEAEVAKRTSCGR